MIFKFMINFIILFNIVNAENLWDSGFIQYKRDSSLSFEEDLSRKMKKDYDEVIVKKLKIITENIIVMERDKKITNILVNLNNLTESQKTVKKERKKRCKYYAVRAFYYYETIGEDLRSVSKNERKIDLTIELSIFGEDHNIISLFITQSGTIEIKFDLVKVKMESLDTEGARQGISTIAKGKTHPARIHPVSPPVVPPRQSINLHRPPPPPPPSSKSNGYPESLDALIRVRLTTEDKKKKHRLLLQSSQKLSEDDRTVSLKSAITEVSVFLSARKRGDWDTESDYIGAMLKTAELKIADQIQTLLISHILDIYKDLESMKYDIKSNFFESRKMQIVDKTLNVGVDRSQVEGDLKIILDGVDILSSSPNDIIISGALFGVYSFHYDGRYFPVTANDIEYTITFYQDRTGNDDHSFINIRHLAKRLIQLEKDLNKKE